MSASTLMNVSHSASVPTPARMNYIELVNRFWQLDTEQRFGANATRLYFYLVSECNRQRWTNPFTLADSYLILALKMPKNTMKPARQELLDRGLIAHQKGGNGAGDAAVYALQNGEEITPFKVSKSDPLLLDKGSGKVSKSDPLLLDKGSGKVSDFDPTIKEVNKTCSVVENKTQREDAAAVAAARAQKKIGAVEQVDFLASEQYLADEPGARASHTGGGRPGPAHLDAEELPIHPVRIDETLPDTEWDRWAKVPRDAQMVNDYLRRINSPHAGKGELFFDYYTSVGWVIGKNRMPCQFWKSLIKSFRFTDPSPATGPGRPVAGPPAGELNQRASAVDTARELIRQRKNGFSA